MKTLGANTIRVYHVDSSADHSGCMNAFAAAGIYLFIDMDTVGTYITEVGQAETLKWIFVLHEANHGYRLGYLAGRRPSQTLIGLSWTISSNTTTLQVSSSAMKCSTLVCGLFLSDVIIAHHGIASDAGAAPYVLAAATDIKAYRDAKGYRKIPVGYSATDTAVLRPMLQDYLVCNQNASERIDFYSLNSYEWCGQSSYMQSGYSILQGYAQGYPVPIFFSEDGCNTVPPRTFDDQAAIFGPQMANSWSGAIIYEWIQETNNYGLVNYGPFAGASVIEGSSVING